MRAALREAAFSRLGMMVGIMDDENARDADRIRAWSEVATFGLGRADHSSVHLHAEGSVTLGIVQLPALDRQSAEIPKSGDTRALPPDTGTASGVTDATS